MILGALLDAGLDFETLGAELSKLNLDEYGLSAEQVLRSGIGGTKFNVILHDQEDHHHHEHDHEHAGHDHDHDDHDHDYDDHDHDHGHSHRNLGDVKQIIEDSSLSAPVKEQSIEIFTRLAQAEAKVHRSTVDQVHFHEVGAVDAIVDIVGACIGFESLGINEIHCSELVTGSGHVHCAHGTMPVPAPATAELIQGVPARAGNIEKELLTPTGAAILVTLAESFGPRPEFTTTSTGYGAGTRDFHEHPNLLRVFIGNSLSKSSEEEDQVWMVETNLDDISAEAIGYVTEQLFESGALDVYTTPIQMKKNRPAVLLSVIVDSESLDAIETLLLEETTTFGIRRYQVQRRKLSREIRPAVTSYGEVRIKIGRMNGRVVRATPEYEDCKLLAGESGAPFNRVYSEAAQKAAEWLD
jgi:uncharacterized protein (TIGR00299 family) protein